MSRKWWWFGPFGKQKAQDSSTAATASFFTGEAATTTRAIGADDVRAALDAFRKDPSPRTTGALREVLWGLADFILRQPADALSSLWTDALRPMREALKGSGLRAPARDAREDQRLGVLRLALAQDWNSPTAAGAAAAGMLLAYAYELPVPAPLRSAPEWLRLDWAAFLLEMPDVFNREGDAEAYAAHLLHVVRLFHGEIESGREERVVWELGDVFLKQANFIQAYFNERNLRELYRLRGDIITRMLSWSGAQCLYALPPRTTRHGRVRAGSYAQQFSAHTETFFSIAALDFLDREKFEVILYANSKTGHALEQYAVSRCDRFVVLPGGSGAADVQTLRNDDLDILLIGTNMSAVTNTATLLGVHRLARVQVASESSPVTTGLHAMDVLLSAEWNAPNESAPDHYTELLFLMPGSNNVYAFQYDQDRAGIEVTRESLGLAQDRIVYFSGANYLKILPELSAVWARILAQVPNSVLVLMPFNRNWLGSYQDAPFLARISSQLSSAGVAPDRLKLLQSVPTRADLHRIIGLADVYLDSYPFAGACSLVDTLVAGVPPVARRGSTNRSGHAASMLRAIGMEEVVADSAEAYVALAVRLGQDRPLRDRLAARLNSASVRDNPPFQDTRSYSTRVGAAFGNLVGAYDDYYRELAALNPEELVARTAALVPAGEELEAGLSAFNDIAINESFLVPFFRAHADVSPRMFDVGACFGQIALPFLTSGWEVHLFEPDPDSRRTLAQNSAAFGPKARVIGAAVSSAASASLSFHKSRTPGLSGLSASPYGETAQVIEVPCLRLDEYCTKEGIDRIEFLKIDAEGHDFEALESLDLARVTPRIIMLEFGTNFAGQTLDTLNGLLARMKGHGYGSVIFAYDDDSNLKRGVWSYRVKRVLVDAPCPETGGDWFGNILFFRAGDTAFLLTLHALLDSARPRRAFLARLEPSVDSRN
jgi:FkbM family methyltransferase